MRMLRVAAAFSKQSVYSPTGRRSTVTRDIDECEIGLTIKGKSSQTK